MQCEKSINGALENGLVACAEMESRDIHGRCSRLRGVLNGRTGYQCPICTGKVQCRGAEEEMEIRLGEDKD